MFKRFLSAVIILYCMASVLIAGEAVDPTLLNPILEGSVRSSVVFNVALQDIDYYNLYRTDTNQSIPLVDLSRQFLAPGAYKLSYEKFGYRIRNHDFTLGSDQEMVINHKPDQVSPQLLQSAGDKKRSLRKNILYSLALLAVSGGAKYLADRTYNEYQNETDPDTIVELRETCQIYDYSCLASAGFSTFYMGLSFKSLWNLRSSKKDIRNAMRR